MDEIISKIDAASRQLDTAISLWFQEGDPVPIHTLACSAHEIIDDLIKQCKGTPLLFDSDSIKSLVYQKYHHKIEYYLKKQYNFLKHADKDPNDCIELDPELSEVFMWFSCKGLKQLGSYSTIVQNYFIIYFTAINPDFLSKDGYDALIQVLPLDTLADARMLSRKEFLWVIQQHSNLFEE